MELSKIYDEIANDFSKTREKYWIEFDIIYEYIKTFNNPYIIDLWCWDWRFFWYLKNKNFEFKYLWVDISKNLIEIAKTKYGDFFINDDMILFLEKQKQEVFDIILLIASFHHLKKNERLKLLINAYKSLKFWWKLIMINRSFSSWFLKKYKFEILKWIFKFILSFWFYSWNDLYIPWKWKKIYYRYYHIFLLSELRYLLKSTGFVIEKLWYIWKDWYCNWKESRNTLAVAVKDVI